MTFTRRLKLVQRWLTGVCAMNLFDGKFGVERSRIPRGPGVYLFPDPRGVCSTLQARDLRAATAGTAMPHAQGSPQDAAPCARRQRSRSSRRRAKSRRCCGERADPHAAAAFQRRRAFASCTRRLGIRCDSGRGSSRSRRRPGGSSLAMRLARASARARGRERLLMRSSRCSGYLGTSRADVAAASRATPPRLRLEAFRRLPPSGRRATRSSPASQRT